METEIAITESPKEMLENLTKLFPNLEIKNVSITRSYKYIDDNDNIERYSILVFFVHNVEGITNRSSTYYESLIEAFNDMKRIFNALNN